MISPLELGFIYLVFSFIVSYTLNLPVMVRTFMALPAFIIIPSIFGYSITSFFKKFALILKYKDNFSLAIVSFNIGLITITMLVIILNLLKFLNFYYIFLIVFTIFTVLSLKLDKIKNDFHLNIDDLRLFLICILIATFISFYVTIFSPFPFMPESDPFRFNRYVMLLIHQNHLTFQSYYLPTFTILSALINIVFNLHSRAIDSFGIFWAARFLLFPLYTLGLYLFAYEISKNKSLSIVTALIGPFATQKFLNFYIPVNKGIIYLLIPFFIFFIHRNIIKDRKFEELTPLKASIIFIFFSLDLSVFYLIFSLIYPHSRARYIAIIFIGLFLLLFLQLKLLSEELGRYFILFSSVSLTLLWIHIPMGILVIAFLILYMFFSWGVQREVKLVKYLGFFIILFCGFFIFIQYYEIYNISNIITFDLITTGNPQTFSFQDKLSMLFEMYHPILIYLSIIGMGLSLMNRDLKHELSLLILVSISLISYFLPFSFMERIIIFLAPLIAYYASVTIIAPINIWGLEKNKRLKGGYFAIIFLILFGSILITPYMNHINYFTSSGSKSPNDYFRYKDSEGHFTLYTSYEVEAAKWIEKNNVEEFLIISDPFTQFIMSGLSKNSYNVVRIMSNSTQQDKIHQILVENNVTTIRDEINKILEDKSSVFLDYDYNPKEFESRNPKEDFRVLFITTGRTIFWLENRKMGTPFIENYPRKLYNPSYLKKFKNIEHFDLVYKKDNQIYIYELKLGKINV